jgi:uncharacterized membrane protein YhaH (DUF805 family)
MVIAQFLLDQMSVFISRYSSGNVLFTRSWGAGVVKEFVRVFSRWKDFHGRSTRREFWMCTLVLMLLSVLLGVLDAILFGAEASATQFLTLSNAFALITFIPSLTVSVRRLHDIDKMWMVATDLPGGYWCFFNPLLELCC